MHVQISLEVWLRYEKSTFTLICPDLMDRLDDLRLDMRALQHFPFLERECCRFESA